MTAADQPTTEPSAPWADEPTTWIEDDYFPGKVKVCQGTRASSSAIRIPRDAVPLLIEQLTAALPAPQPAADTETEVQGGPLCSTCDGVGLVGSNHMNSGPCPACTERDGRLRGIQERAEAASTGPWSFQHWGGQNQNGDHTESILFDVRGEDLVYGLYDPDGEFIAAARADVPWLLDEVARLDAVVTAVRDLHPLRRPSWEVYFTCDGCGYIADDENDPCPTVRALDGGAA